MTTEGTKYRLKYDKNGKINFFTACHEIKFDEPLSTSIHFISKLYYFCFAL